MPNRFQSINSAMPLPQIVAAMNRNFAALDGEANTKVISGPGGKPAKISGLLPTGKFGDLFYDADGRGIAQILLGQAPDDGRPGLWIMLGDYDVLSELGGG